MIEWSERERRCREDFYAGCCAGYRPPTVRYLCAITVLLVQFVKVEDKYRGVQEERLFGEINQTKKEAKRS